MEREKLKIDLPKTLVGNLFPGSELKRKNGSLNFFKSGKTIIGHLSDFEVNIYGVPEDDYLVTYNKEPTNDSKIVVQSVNNYTVKLKVS